MNDGIVIIGTGLGGYTLARELRKRDRDVPLTLVTADDGAFYSKPMLSNALDKGKAADELVQSTAEEMAASLDATILTHRRILAIDPAERRVKLNGDRLAWDRLVLALGADPIRLGLSGDAVHEILSVNDLRDYRRFRQALVGARRVVILGAGLIGCEFADDLARAGYHVALVDPMPRPLGRLLPPRAGARMRDALAERGVEWHLETTAESVARREGILQVMLADGTELAADLVLSAVGLRPRVDLAREAGLQVGRGIRVDRWLTTSEPNVYALGDCAEVEGLVLPFVMPLMAEARALAATLAGTPTPLVLPALPVAVKTPDCPVVVCPPPPGAEGGWQEEETGEGVRGLWRSPDGRLLGFALVGDAVADKQALAREVPPLFPAA
ncbi:MAG TPA: FAD-dependent oxidoreductase [Thiotrichales bacterium]|nr:FAD-dependent oxidoreductase [Thiotrichales bacterium]